ncbi:hypothetical protein [Pseudomonas aeruginosa]|uniref:hypothetical protein n=1 Tax=Pseudomonas aeruginosa TaxID=287 RepID=UPI000F82C249|nr:hypothetical protein [Pseudomonas aeruginosa]EKU7451935.1 hypothetical protein [Pseudomonas aeruginosa]MBI8586057.1 hypothetical protein [Pseudomonas aeruginosa]MCS8067595.1 hypothetical protein [Pseudomonas aeruginosa]RTW66410.1 hypothetical protein DZA10_10675 [Pseudomonas aeruginosa]HEH8527713.1 hypothetical protein [Pseudomonas aeruginosa]
MTDLFYLQDSRSNVGSRATFWRAGGGYTTNDNDPFVCRRLAGRPAYQSPRINWQPARKALEQIATLTDVSTGGIGRDILQIAKKASSSCSASPLFDGAKLDRKGSERQSQ